MDIKAECRPIADDELLIIRTFDAPAALVFRIWEDRDHMIRWFGPKEFSCPSLEMDFRPGGAWRACIRSSAGKDSWMGGTYREIIRNKRIVYSFAWDEGSGPTQDTLITVTFEERDGKTTQSFHQTPFASVEARDSHIRGWTQFIDKEQGYAEWFAHEVNG